MTSRLCAFFVGECGEGGDHTRCKQTDLVLVFIDPTMEDNYVFRNWYDSFGSYHLICVALISGIWIVWRGFGYQHLRSAVS
ncbi:hypothetical protein Hanom_Chr02g00136501 [Helianthus anomalus]